MNPHPRSRVFLGLVVDVRTASRELSTPLPHIFDVHALFSICDCQLTMNFNRDGALKVQKSDDGTNFALGECLLHRERLLYQDGAPSELYQTAFCSGGTKEHDRVAGFRLALFVATQRRWRPYFTDNPRKIKILKIVVVVLQQ